MRVRTIFRRALVALGIVLLLGSMPPSVYAQKGCMTFGQARKLGLFAKFNMRPAGAVKKMVEARTGGKVVSFVVCRSGSGPVYQLTVVRPNGNVLNVTEPAH